MVTLRKPLSPTLLCGIQSTHASQLSASNVDSIPFAFKVTAAAAATKDASCAATTWEIFDEQSKGLDQGVTDDGVYGGAGSKANVGSEETAVQRQANELAAVTLARYDHCTGLRRRYSCAHEPTLDERVFVETAVIYDFVGNPENVGMY